jgi:hypothetical protein
VLSIRVFVFRIFNFQKAYAVRRSILKPRSRVSDPKCQILDEIIIAGELQESSKKSVLRVVRSYIPSSLPVFPLKSTAKVTQADGVEEQENSEDTIARLSSRTGKMFPPDSHHHRLQTAAFFTKA